jgi:prepilin-type N-terminal cleavage/methylation domain-containing protein/prepilin-type processing-associated H-X9-DG protein
MNTRSPRRAFTLIELLVVLTVIALLTCLLLPAVLNGRATADRMGCANKLKQLALASHHHHDARGSFPPGFVAIDAGVGRFAGGTTLFVELLPYLEQQSLYQTWNYSDYRSNIAGGPGATSGRVVPGLMCPSDPLPGNPADWTDMGSIFPDFAWASGFYGQSSYGGNGGTLSFTDGNFPAPSRDGVFHASSRMRLADISDGSSQTLLFGERSHRDPEYDRATAAWDPGFGPLARWSSWAWAGYWDGSAACVTLSTPVPINYRVPALSDPGDWLWEGNRLCAFGSNHAGGANFAFADGSVRFIRETTPLPLLQALSTRAGGEVTGEP